MTPETPAKPKRPQPAKDGSSVFVVRGQLASRFALKPPTDEQRQIIADNKIHLWPNYYEFKNGDAVKEVLTAMDLGWSDSKGKA